MADDDQSAGLTGVWDGEYSYPRKRAPTRFTAVLFEGDGGFSGSVHEQPTDGSSAGIVLYASLDGRRSGARVTFDKVYEKPDKSRRKPVHYEGTLSADGCEIAGVWAIVGAWSGKFVMTRPRRQTKEARVKRRASVPAD